MIIKSADRLTRLLPYGLTHILCFEKKKKTKQKKKLCVFWHERLSSTVRSKKLSIIKGQGVTNLLHKNGLIIPILKSALFIFTFSLDKFWKPEFNWKNWIVNERISPNHTWQCLKFALSMYWFSNVFQSIYGYDHTWQNQVFTPGGYSL